MKLPKELDTTEWAKAQDAIFAGKSLPETACKFDALMRIQEEIGPTNLTLRQRLIRSSIFKMFPPLSVHPLMNSIDVDFSVAISQFNALHKNGYWIEGASYWDYVKVGLEWYRKRHGLPDDMISAMEAITASYEAIKPCPLPEVRDMREPGEGPDYVSTTNYFQKRFRNPDGTVRGYLLIAMNTEAEPRNLHSHLEAGYFAFWTGSNGWVHRCKPYTGFDFKESLTSASLAVCLPSGAMPTLWRLNPPKVNVSLERDKYCFTWNNGLLSRQSRIIEILSDKVIVTDGGLFRKIKVTEYEI